MLRSFSHDSNAFTQGIFYDPTYPDSLFESTGIFGKSSIRRVELESGNVQQITPLHKSLFGEGIAMVGDTIYQLTWQNLMVLVWQNLLSVKLQC